VIADRRFNPCGQAPEGFVGRALRQSMPDDDVHRRAEHTEWCVHDASRWLMV
jgi:hypothetical protein